MNTPTYTDGTITLNRFELDDVDAHLAGDDGDTRRWLGGGEASTVDTVTDWVTGHLSAWGTNTGTRRLFAVRVNTAMELCGYIEANTDWEALGYAPGDVNISYAVLPGQRGCGYARRAVHLMCEHLTGVDDAATAVLLIDPANAPSLRVAHAAGFRDCGFHTTATGERMRCFKLDLTVGR